MTLEEKKEIQRAKNKKNYQLHGEKYKAQRKEQRLKDLKGFNLKRQEYRKTIPERIKAWNRNHRFKKYGLTEISFSSLLSGQNNVCAICKTNTWGRYGPVIDHCHLTGAVRGILCSNCNTGIGLLKDSAILTKSATTYLEGV